MYLSSITANILNKFNNQNINVLYEPQRNLFDIFLAECGYTLYFDSKFGIQSINKTNMVGINDIQMNLFNYNVGITNNIINYASNKVFSNLHLNAIIFTHSYRPKGIKKEDLLLMSNNLSKEQKVFFSQDAADSWNFLSNKTVIKYGIPLDMLSSETPFTDRNDKILLLNFESTGQAESIANLIESNGLKVDLIKDITGDINAVRELFNRYKVVIDFNDHNVVNLLAAVSCGCKCIAYMSDMIVQDYSSVPNLFMAKSVQDLISISKNCISDSKIIEPKSYIEENYNFNTFKTNIKTIVEKSNNEAFIL